MFHFSFKYLYMATESVSIVQSSMNMMDVTVAFVNIIPINKIRSAKTIRNVLHECLPKMKANAMIIVAKIIPTVILYHLLKFHQNRMVHWGLLLSPYVCNIPKRLMKLL